MPRGPNSEKRPADVVGATVLVAKIATGKIDDEAAEDDQPIDFAFVERDG